MGGGGGKMMAAMQKHVDSSSWTAAKRGWGDGNAASGRQCWRSSNDGSKCWRAQCCAALINK